MKKEQLEQVKKELENIISGYSITINRLTEKQKECRKINNHFCEKEFRLYNQEKYLEWENVLVRRQEISNAESYYENVLRKVFYQMSMELITLFFKVCKNRRDITDFEKLMEYNQETKSYPYVVNLSFCNDDIRIYLHNNYNSNIDYRYYNNNSICESIWNSKKGKYDYIIHYENFESNIESEYHKNCIKHTTFNNTINYDIKDIINEFKVIKELQEKHKKELEQLMQQQKEELIKKDIYGVADILNKR